MKKFSLAKTLFSFWTLLIILSISWLIFIFYNNINLIFSNILILIALFVSVISFSLSIFFITLILIDLRREIKEDNIKKKNVKDLYSYDQVVEPPSMYN